MDRYKVDRYKVDRYKVSRRWWLRGAELLCVLSLATSACVGQDPNHNAGTITLALSTDTNGVQYRLRDALFDIEGPASIRLTTEDNPDASNLEAELPAGSYTITLQDGWRLERSSGSDFETVDAELVSDNPLGILIERDLTAPANFHFALVEEPPSMNLADLFGFEDASLWSSSAELALSDVRVQALHSLSVRGGGFHFVSSTPMQSVELSGDSVVVALRLPPEQPNPHWWGDVQLVLHAPSIGLREVSVGVVPLTGLPTREFVDLEFSLEQFVLDALSADYDDLVIRLALNTPHDATGIYRFDNMRFAGVSSCDFSCSEGTCVAGICEIPCTAGQDDCDGDPTNGCETTVLADSSNCGSCGVQCAPGHVCEASECVISTDCSENEADCDGDPSNSCEVDVLRDVNHCGGCGIACVAGHECVDGLCLGGDLDVSLQVTADWGAGYCASLVLTNLGAGPTNYWQVVLDTQGATISPWNVNVTGTTGNVTLTPLSWNAQIAAGASDQSVGLCATRTSGNAVATVLSVVP